MAEKKSYKVWLDEGNRIITHTQIEDDVIDKKMAEDISNSIDSLSKDNPDVKRLLVDLLNLKTIPDSPARSIIASLAKRYSSFRLALTSGFTALRLAINFMIVASGHKNARAFSNTAEAIKWLKESQ